MLTRMASGLLREARRASTERFLTFGCNENPSHKIFTKRRNIIHGVGFHDECVPDPGGHENVFDAAPPSFLVIPHAYGSEGAIDPAFEMQDCRVDNLFKEDSSSLRKVRRMVVGTNRPSDSIRAY